MTATIEPTKGFWVKEFSLPAAADDDSRSTYYEDTGGELMLKVAERPATSGAVVAVTVDIDEGEHHLVQVDTRSLSEFEAMTEAAEAILRVRDHLLKLHGYANFEEFKGAVR